MYMCVECILRPWERYTRRMVLQDKKLFFLLKKTAIYTFQYLKIKLEKKFNYPLEGNNKSLCTCVWDVYCARGSDICVACVRITT